MEQNNLPSNPAQITKELVRVGFNIEATRLNYEVILQSVEDIVWTRTNIDQPLLEPAKFIASKLTEKKEQDKRPFIDAGKIIQSEYNDFFNPINDAISRKANERKALAGKIQEEEDNVKREADRINTISSTIATFISNITNDITASDNDKMIIAAEMRIGSELSRKNIYMEFLPNLKEQCEELKPLIKKQKEYVRVLKDVNKNQAAAIASGDDSTAVEMRMKAEEMKEIIDENKIRLQQKAFEQVENSNIYVGEPTTIAPNATRTTWKWRVDDLALLFKKMPGLVDLVPNKDKIDAILKEKRTNGEMEGKREEKMFGITFYEDKSYK